MNSVYESSNESQSVRLMGESGDQMNDENSMSANGGKR